MKKILVLLTCFVLIILISGCPGIFNKFIFEVPDRTIKEGEPLVIDLSTKVSGGSVTCSFSLLEGDGTIVDCVYTLLTDFSSAGEYTIKISATDSAGKESISVFKVTVEDVNVKPEVELTTPEINCTDVKCESLELTWAATDFDNDGLKYDLYFGTSSEPGIYINDLEATSFVMDSLTKGTKYYWKVIAEDRRGAVTESDKWNFTTVGLPSPVIVSPQDTSTDNSWDSLTLSWDFDDESEVLYYDIYFGKDELPGIYRIGYDATELTISNLDRGETYYWQIVVTDEPYSRVTNSEVGLKEKESLALIRKDKAASIGEVWNFTTKENQNPVAIVELSPLDGIMHTGNDVLLSWNCSDPDGDDLKYDICFGKSQTNLTPYSSNISGKKFWIYDLNPGVTYFWQIVAKDSYGGSTQSEINEFSPRNIVKLTGGYGHTVALNYDGTVLSWGMNDYGELGIGSTNKKTIPSATLFPAEIIDVSCGDNHTLALTSDGVIYSAGRNDAGQLGIGTTSSYESIPASIDSTYNFVKIAAGGYYSLAITSTGEVLSWGENTYGQLGNGTTIDSPVPVLVTGLTGVVDISAGLTFAVALKSDGTVWAWGLNNYGQLGDGSKKNMSIPIEIIALSDIVQISSGDIHTLALENDGTVWTWGCNAYGQLGLGYTSGSVLPSKLVNLSGIKQVHASGSKAAYSGHSFALENDGTVWTWGCNACGQLGTGTTIDEHSPVKLDIYNVSFVGGGVGFSLAKKEDGTIWAWGHNRYGQLGDGTLENRLIPTVIK